MPIEQNESVLASAIWYVKKRSPKSGTCSVYMVDGGAHAGKQVGLIGTD